MLALYFIKKTYIFTNIEFIIVCNFKRMNCCTWLLKKWWNWYCTNTCTWPISRVSTEESFQRRCESESQAQFSVTHSGQRLVRSCDWIRVGIGWRARSTFRTEKSLCPACRQETTRLTPIKPASFLVCSYLSTTLWPYDLLSECGRAPAERPGRDNGYTHNIHTA